MGGIQIQPMNLKIKNKTKQNNIMKSITSILAVLALSVSFASAADEKKAAADGEKPKRNPAETIKKLDKDGDGKVSAEEWKASPTAKTDPAKAAESFKKLDKDGDGFITLEEMAVVGGKKGKK